MTKREKEILEAIKNNPLISQNELAEMFNISSNTIGVHISNLSKAGYILGRAFLIKEDDYILGIGAANIDIYGESDIEIKKNFDHPSRIHVSLGGVSRNVLENLSRLGSKTKLLTAVGSDRFAEMIIKGSEDAHIDMSNVLKVHNSSSSIFMQVMDDYKEMHLALCDMNIIKHIDVDYLREKERIIKGSNTIVFDPSLNEKSIEHIIHNYKDKELFLDPVSDLYARKIKTYVSSLYALKPNKSELEAMTHETIKTKKDIIKAGEKLINKGLKHLFITNGKDGCIYMNHDRVIERKLNYKPNIINTSGAGDAFFAGIIYGISKEYEMEKTLDIALACASITVESKEPINKDLDIYKVEKMLKEKK